MLNEPLSGRMVTNDPATADSIVSILGIGVPTIIVGRKANEGTVTAPVPESMPRAHQGPELWADRSSAPAAELLGRVGRPEFGMQQHPNYENNNGTRASPIRYRRMTEHYAQPEHWTSSVTAVRTNSDSSPPLTRREGECQSAGRDASRAGGRGSVAQIACAPGPPSPLR